jgi:HK97 family phage major capsid protein
MSKLSDLEAKRAAKLQRLSDMKDLRITESREFTQEEESEWDRTSTEVKTLNTQILREQEVEDLDIVAVKKKVVKDTKTAEEKVMAAFSIARGLDSLFKKDRLTGVELEMKQEAEKELRDSKGPVSEIEGVGIPGFMLNMKGRNVIDGHKINRDLTVGGAATGAELVNEEYKGHIYGLNIAPKVIEMGATTLMGLVGTPKFSKSGTVTTTWEGENDANAEGTPSTGEITMTPKRLGVFIDISKMLNAQTNGMANASLFVRSRSA